MDNMYGPSTQAYIVRVKFHPSLTLIPLCMSQRLSRRPRAVPKRSWALAAHGSWQSGRLLTIEARYSVFVAGLRILIKGAAVIIDPLTRTHRGLGYQTSKICDFFSPSLARTHLSRCQTSVEVASRLHA
jgi:hypothetical protein